MAQTLPVVSTVWHVAQTLLVVSTARHVAQTLLVVSTVWHVAQTLLVVSTVRHVAQTLLGVSTILALKISMDPAKAVSVKYCLMFHEAIQFLLVQWYKFGPPSVTKYHTGEMSSKKTR